MTEDELKTKECRVSSPLFDNAKNRVHWPLCSGSACAQYRTLPQWWDSASDLPGWLNFEPYGFEAIPDNKRDYSYCGLAGRPQ